MLTCKIKFIQLLYSVIIIIICTVVYFNCVGNYCLIISNYDTCFIIILNIISIEYYLLPPTFLSDS